MVQNNQEYKKWKVLAYLTSMLILLAQFVGMLVAVTIIPLGPFNKPEFLISGVDVTESEQITLSNGIKAILAKLSVEDQGFVTLAMSVNAGSVNDPGYFQGRSNTFREDVQNSDDLVIKLSKGGGRMISSIQKEYTSYAIEAQSDVFESIIETFVEVLSSSSLYRDIKPAKNKEKDDFLKVGEHLLFKQEQDNDKVSHLNIRKELMQLRNECYVGEKITLVVQSGVMELSELSDIAKLFEDIPETSPVPLSDKHSILNKSHLNHVAYMVEESNRIEVWWITQPILNPRKTSHKFFLALMAYPGEHGPFGQFRDLGWAWDISTEINTESDQYSILKIKLHLTDSGVINWEVIVGAFYEYLKMVDDDDEIWNLYQKATLADFNIQSLTSLDSVLEMSYNNIKFEDPLSVAFGVNLVESKDSSNYDDVYAEIIPENSLVLISSVGDKFRNRVADGTFFGLEKLSNREWTSGLNMALPSSEEYIPTLFKKASCSSFYQEKYTRPRMEAANDQYSYWLWVDCESSNSLVEIYLNLLFDNASATAHDFTLGAVYSNHVILRMMDKIEFGYQAGNVVSSILSYAESLTFKISTSNEIADIVFEALLDILENGEVSNIDFEIAVAKTRFQFLEIDRDAANTAFSNYVEYFTSSDSVLENLALIRADEVAAYARKIWENNFANIFISGSYSESQAESLAEKYGELKDRKGGDTSPTEFTRYQVGSINGYFINQRTVRQKHISQTTLFLWNQQGVDSQAKVQVITDLMNIEGSFDKDEFLVLEDLRNSYLANMGATSVTFRSMSENTGYQFLVIEVDLPLDLANIDLVERQIEALTQLKKDLESVDESLYAKSGQLLANNYHDEIFTQSFAFDRQNQVQAFKAKISKSELLSEFDRVILKKPEASVLQTYPRTIEFFNEWSPRSQVVTKIDEYRDAIPDTFKLTTSQFQFRIY